jgi:hypothetical protein
MGKFAQLNRLVRLGVRDDVTCITDREQSYNKQNVERKMQARPRCYPTFAWNLLCDVHSTTPTGLGG